MENKQTAVEFLIEHIKLDAMHEAKSIDEWVNIFKRAKAMEKEQIEKAFQHSIVAIVVGKVLSPEKYYNETYGK